MKDSDNLETQLKLGFIDEALQLISDSENCFLTLETNPSDKAVLENIFRLFHNLKGSAKAVGFDDLGAFTHELESFLLKLKNDEFQASSDIVNFLLQCNDRIQVMVGALRDNFDAKVDWSDLLQYIVTLQSNPSPTAVQTPTLQTGVPAAEQSFEELAQETESQLQSFELNQEPQQDSNQEAQKVEVDEGQPQLQTKAQEAAATAQKNADDSIRVSLSRVEKLINYVGELVIVQTVLQEQSSNTQSLLLRKTVHQLGKITKEVQDLSMSLRMVPLKQTFLKMQRIVRDTAQSVAKKVILEVSGEDTEVDKTILERLSDPLVHMIRNAVDHGIESAEVRRERNKPETGTIKLSAYHQSGSLVIEIRDDGGGLDAEKLKTKAIAKGFLQAGSVMTDQEAYHLIFLPGFSTKEQVSDVSGRGVGMDVVKSNIKQLQGDVSIDTELARGSCFKIKLPLTLAIIHGMVIHCSDERYVIPLAHVHESIRPKKEDIKFTSGVGEFLLLRQENIPFYRISHLLNKRSKSTKEAWDGIAIVVRTQETPFAILVDDIIGQYQIVIKSLGKEIQQIKGFSGSAILGDGRPALILELGELIKKAKPIDPHSLSQPQIEKRSVA
jgi:two-component system chemotaxis sensor kinase CheA